MIPRSFFSRMIAPFAIVLALLLAGGGALIYQTGEHLTRLRRVDELQRVVQLAEQINGVARNSSPEIKPTDRWISPAGAARLNEAGRLLGARVTLFDASGRVLFDTASGSSGPAELAAAQDEQTVRRAQVDDAGISYAEDPRDGTIYIAELLDPRHPDGPVVRLGYADSRASGLGRPAATLFGGAVVAAGVAVAVLSLLLRRLWVVPTRNLVKAAEQMAAGQWGRRVDPEGSEELCFFSTRFNFVASQAQQQLDDLKHQRADLQALVDTLPDPILVTDAAGKLILINPPAARLVEMPEPRVLGQAFVNVVNDEAILQLFERVLACANRPPTPLPDSSALPITRDIRLNRGGQRLTYQAVATLTPGKGVLLMLRDVSALTAAVQMKTDFVANASHELRTPIAAIKIAFETLRDVYGDDAQQSERCMHIIEGHLRRLEEMLGDLLDLSKVERDNIDTNVRDLKTAEVFSHIRSSLGPMARQKGVEIRLGQDGQQVEQFRADEVLLNLVLKNLMENSIKYTPAGGCVRLNFRASEPQASGPDGAARSTPVVLTVSDTGIGIPPEHLDRVFERFYQVDPARSGSAGRGTGLGLAIVKHAIAALDGTVQIQSTVGAGTTVTCILPQDNQSKRVAGEEQDEDRAPAAA